MEKGKTKVKHPRRVIRSESQREASRRNGAKSGGRNARTRAEELAQVAETNEIRAQELAGTVVLPGEADDYFLELVNTLRQQLQPACEVEAALIETMAMARWRQLRTANLQRDVTATEMQEHDGPAPNRYFASMRDHGEAILALRKQEQGYHREFVMSVRTLMQWKKLKLRPGPEPVIELTAGSRTWKDEEALDLEKEEVLDDEPAID